LIAVVEWTSYTDTSEDLTFFTGTLGQEKLDSGIILNSGFDWDVIRVELWLDSGRIIVFPALDPLTERVERSGCQLICDELVAFYERLVDCDIGDDEFDEEIARKELEIVDNLTTGLRQCKANLAGSRVIFVSPDEKNVLQEVTA
jgi:hypothetical protein